jgi:hypothetical protein
MMPFEPLRCADGHSIRCNLHAALFACTVNGLPISNERIPVSGESYEWWDTTTPRDENNAVRYWLEDVDLHGKRPGTDRRAHERACALTVAPVPN